MKTSCFILSVAVVVMIALAAKLQFDNLGWRDTAKSDIAYAASLADQYRELHDKTATWPDADQLMTRLTFIESTVCRPGAHGSAVCERIDTYRAGLYGRLQLSVHLMKDGTIQYTCNQKPNKP